jgi:CheY-like chemotaxis protein
MKSNNHVQLFNSNVKKNILVVDDDFDIANTIKLWLQRFGFRTFEFTDPVQALEYFYEKMEDINLVLSDIRMPQMNGYELVIKIKTLKPKIKIILMSAFEIREGELSRVLPSIKIDGLISKPISLKSLVEIVKNTI